jgi:hypothetical protein
LSGCTSVAAGSSNVFAGGWINRQWQQLPQTKIL